MIVISQLIFSLLFTNAEQKIFVTPGLDIGIARKLIVFFK